MTSQPAVRSTIRRQEVVGANPCNKQRYREQTPDKQQQRQAEQPRHHLRVCAGPPEKRDGPSTEIGHSSILAERSGAFACDIIG